MADNRAIKAGVFFAALAASAIATAGVLKAVEKACYAYDEWDKEMEKVRREQEKQAIKG